MNRRDFLKTSAAAGLVLGFHLPGRAATTAPARVNAWVRIAPDNSVTLMIHKGEMGQGTLTSLSQLLADELDIEWTQIRTEFPPIDKAFGMQGVVGSQSIRTGWDPLRRAGAAARQMLAQAGAKRWGVAETEVRAVNGVVTNTASGAKFTYGELAEDAAKLQAPSRPKLKDPSEFRYIGKSMKRLDTRDKVSGKTRFGIDVRIPGMVYAAVARSPVVGGKVISFDATKAKAIPGVKDFVRIPSGIAVIADNTWSAFEGVKALDLQFEDGPNAQFSTAGISKMLTEKTLKPGVSARKVGDAPAAIAGAAKTVEAVYEVPYLSHAPMEPPNCVVHVREDGCDVWASTQMQTMAYQIAVKITGLAPEKVNLHSEFMGGGFGRRGSSDFVAEAVEIGKAIKVPVKLTWSREDDLRHDFYRPASVTRFAAGLDAAGWPVGLSACVACPSIMFSTMGMEPFKGIDPTSVEGLGDLRYDIPLDVSYHWTEAGLQVSYWRAVGYTQNTFFAESFVDELAAAGGKDPVELRRRMLTKSPRLLNVLNLAAEKAGWGKPLPAGRSRGIAVVNNVGSFTAQVAEVSVDKGKKGKVTVHRVVSVTDCGHVVNPAIIEQQIRSAVVYGLSAALKGEITVKNGRVEQTNFHQYDVLRIDETPNVEVHIVPSTEAPGGIGEAGVPALAPAVMNAIFAATGKRLRKLPVREQLA